MNFLSLERKFQLVDRREADMRVYFDPKSVAGKKHKYIKDLKADYDFDNLIYGLGKYVSDAPSKPRPQHLEMKVEDTPKVSDTTPSPQRKGFKASMRNPSAFHIMQPLMKETYEGVFCTTKIVKPEVLNWKKEQEERDVEPKEMWVSREMGSPVRNRAAAEEVRLVFPRIERRKSRDLEKTEMGEMKRSPSPPRTHPSLLRDQPLPPISKPPPVPESSDPSLSPDILLLKCTKQLQSPFSDNPWVYFESEIPKISIQLLEDTHRDINLRYILQLTDLSVAGYPLTQMEGLYCNSHSNLLYNSDGNVEIDLKSLIKNYQSVQFHTMRLVLLAQGERRRLLERLFFFGPNEPHNEAKLVLDLSRFRSYLTSQIRSSNKPSLIQMQTIRADKEGGSTFQSLLAKVHLSKELPLDFDSPDPMKTITPRHLFGARDDSSIPPLFPPKPPAFIEKKEYRHPVTQGLMNYREEDLMYKHHLYAANLVYLEDQVKYRRVMQLGGKERREMQTPEEEISVTGTGAYLAM